MVTYIRSFSAWINRERLRIKKNLQSLCRRQIFLELFLINKKQILVLFVFAIFSSLFLLVSPYLSRLFVDKAFLGKNISEFYSLAFIGAVLFIFSIVTRVIGDVVKNKIAVKLRLSYANLLTRKLFSLEMSFFQSQTVGENIYRLTDIERMVDFVTEQFPSLLVDLFKLPVILGVSLWINPPMTLLLVILSPLFIIQSVYFQKRLKPLYENIWSHSAKLSQEIYEAFSRMLIIKALGLENYKRHMYLRSLINNIRLRVKSFRWYIFSSVGTSFLSKAIYGLITLYGGWLIINGKISLGTYTAVMLYITQLGGLLQSLGERSEYFVEENVSAEKFFEMMDREPEIKDSPQALIPKSLKSEIRFDHVWFEYEKGRPVLRDVSLILPASSWLAIAGPSGCGKTTLVNLILRLYEPISGRVLWDGIDIRQVRLSFLKNKFALAAQQPLLFDVSIKQNITYGLKDISDEAVFDAADTVCLDEFISQLPDGYDTVIGENAAKLSEGLKQRVALARAIIRNPEALILDEAVSSVDSATEQIILQKLRKKRQGLTTIVISHRLSSVKDADRIYFFRSDGKIEEGRHGELFALSEPYRDFFKNQMEEWSRDNFIAR